MGAFPFLLLPPCLPCLSTHLLYPVSDGPFLTYGTFIAPSMHQGRRTRTSTIPSPSPFSYIFVPTSSFLRTKYTYRPSHLGGAFTLVGLLLFEREQDYLCTDTVHADTEYGRWGTRCATLLTYTYRYAPTETATRFRRTRYPAPP